MNQPDEKSICTRCKKRPYIYGSAQDGLCEVCASRVKAEAVLNPDRLVPKVVAGLRRCVYCSNIVDADQGLGITCYHHAEEPAAMAAAPETIPTLEETHAG